jgi:replicative DNA helicase
MSDSPSSQRRVPQDPGAERALLGAVLLRPDTLGMATEEGLVAEDFFVQAHRVLYECFVGLQHEGRPIDGVTVAGRLAERGQLEGVGGLSFLAGLPASTPSAANFKTYLSAVRECALLRRLLATIDEIADNVHRAELSPSSILEEAEKAVFALGQWKRTSSVFPVGAIVDDVYRSIQRRVELRAQGTTLTGVSTGFRDLDGLLQGFQRTDLVIIAARPAMGKTAFALNIASTAALRHGVPVAFFSLEMGKEQLATRMLIAEARIQGGKVREGDLTDHDWARMQGALEALYEAPVYIDDTPSITLAELRTKARRLKAERDLGLVMIDYLQLMKGTGREQSREQEISGISRGLKGLAKELNIPVVALAQINRGVEQRGDKRPMMSDLRESGAIEQDADVIMFLYRDEVYNPNTDQKGVAEVLVRKHRNGSIGDVTLYWHKELTRFDNLERGQG